MYSLIFFVACINNQPTLISHTPQVSFDNSPKAGNPDGKYPIPPEAMAEDISNPDVVVGSGTPESCTEDAFVKAVAHGGKIVFNSGGLPVTIVDNYKLFVFL